MHIDRIKSLIQSTGYFFLGCVLLFWTMAFLKTGINWIVYPILFAMCGSYTGIVCYALAGKVFLRSYPPGDLRSSFLPFIWASAFSTGFLILFGTVFYLYKRG